MVDTATAKSQLEELLESLEIAIQDWRQDLKTAGHNTDQLFGKLSIAETIVKRLQNIHQQL